MNTESKAASLHAMLMEELGRADVGHIGRLLASLDAHTIDRRIRCEIVRLCGERLMQLAALERLKERG